MSCAISGGRNRQEGGMSNRPARITQAEIERAIRAAKKAGATEVVVKMGDGVITIRIPLVPDQPVAEMPRRSSSNGGHAPPSPATPAPSSHRATGRRFGTPALA